MSENRKDRATRSRYCKKQGSFGKMSWSVMVTVISIFASGHSINRPVYKIVLTQKGFSQFIQYDIDTPPIREFTFCTWIRLYELENEQGLFSYVVNGNRVIRLWLDSGGHFIKVSINEKTPSIISVDIARDTWRHICLSYQSDYGAWALYFDGRLVNCETMQSLYDFVLPGGGSVIIGYGSSNVIPSGLEGEVFGANMLLSSTIERNHTLKKDPLYEQKRFVQNRTDPKGNIAVGGMKTKSKRKPASVRPIAKSRERSVATILGASGMVVAGRGGVVTTDRRPLSAPVASERAPASTTRPT
ncbi:unnamed protein product, partial [Iphiclides podalirius]